MLLSRRLLLPSTASVLLLSTCLALGQGHKARPLPLGIDVWYGPVQSFGKNGNPQRWVNILGRVSGPRGTVSLQYSLNGGPASNLTIGPNGNRLAAAGDFNIELDRGDLREGDNVVSIVALDSQQNKVTRNVTVKYTGGQRCPLPYHIEWSKAGTIHDVAQVVDGLWRLTSEGVRTKEPYYDRVIALGDETWRNYEVTVPVTFHGFRRPGPKDGGRNVIHAAIAVRWPGHDDDGRQPHVKWYPLGATVEFMVQQHPDECRWRILGGGKKRVVQQTGRKIELDRRYVMKLQVESPTDSSTMYRVKFWDARDSEPDEWDLQAEEGSDEVPSGGALLIAHYSDVTFGNVTVNPAGESADAPDG